MDLKSKKEEVEKQLQQNRVDQAQHQQTLSGLARGADYLQGKLDSILALIKEEEEALVAKLVPKNDNSSSGQ